MRWPPVIPCYTACLATQHWEAELPRCSGWITGRCAILQLQWHWVQLAPQAISRGTISAKAMHAPERSQSILCYAGVVDIAFLGKESYSSPSSQSVALHPPLQVKHWKCFTAMWGDLPSSFPFTYSRRGLYRWCDSAPLPRAQIPWGAATRCMNLYPLLLSLTPSRTLHKSPQRPVLLDLLCQVPCLPSSCGLMNS